MPQGILAYLTLRNSCFFFILFYFISFYRFTVFVLLCLFVDVVLFGLFFSNQIN